MNCRKLKSILSGGFQLLTSGGYTNDHKKIPQRVTQQQIGQTRSNTWIPRNTQYSKSELGKNRVSEQTNF